MNTSTTENHGNNATIDRVKTGFFNLLLDVCPPLLDCSRSQLQGVITAKVGSQEIKKFVANQHVRILIVGKEVETPLPITSSNVDNTISRSALESTEKDNDEPASYNIFVSCDIDKRALSCTSIAFLKRPNVNLVDLVAAGDDTSEAPGLDSLGSRLQILSIGWLADSEDRNALAGTAGTAPGVQTPGTTVGAGNPLEAIANYLQYIADPVLATSHQAAAPSEAPVSGAVADEDTMATSANRNILEARKRLTELLVTVQQVQQNLEVPLVQLSVDPTIRDYLQRCKDDKKKISAEVFLSDLGPNAATVLSQLQAGAHKWVKETQKVIRIDRDPTSGSAAEEVNFWISLERALTHIEQQLQSAEVEATLAVLKQAKRFLAAVSFETDTGLRSKLDSVQNVNLLMRDFPLNDLLASRSIDQLTSAIRVIFNHLRRLKNVTQYPFARAYNFVEAISRDLNSQLLKILSTHRLLIISFEEFEHVFNNCRDLSRVWEEEARRFKELVRDQIKKRGMINVLPPKLNCEHTLLLERVEDIRRLRRQHQKLQDVVRRVLPRERRAESAAHREIAAAYNVFQSLEALDISRIGTDNWEAAKKQYNDKIDRVESQMTNRLRDRLGAAKTGVEMFRVFSQFNPLFFRPRIRGAIQEYQASLIAQVKDDLKSLQLKLNETFERSRSAEVATLLDVPRLCGKILWCRQLERKLHENLRRVEDVLGKGWEQHMEGQNLKQIGDELAKKLNPQAVFEVWIQRVRDSRDLDRYSGRLFGVKQHGKNFEIFVNYDPNVMFLFKEVRCLTGLGIRVPYSVKAAAEDAKWIYPYLMILQESIRTYNFTCRRLQQSNFAAITPLIARYQSEVHDLLEEGSKLGWEYEKLNSFTATLCNKVYMLESKLEDLEASVSKIDELIKSLNTAPYNCRGQMFKQTISSIQSIITELALANYAHLHDYTANLNEQLESILSKRLGGLIDAWLSEFRIWPHAGTELIENGSLHAFKVQSQRLYFVPSIEAARQTWMTHFHTTLGTICLLPLLSSDTQASTAALGLSAELRVKHDRTFRYLIERLPSAKLSQAYATIQTTLNDLTTYVNEWLKYQYLWDIETSAVIARVGDNLETWQQLLIEIRASRSTFDTSEERKAFGPLVVDYATAQAKVMTKFEVCHREILNVFGSKTFEQMSQFSAQLRQAREDLETHSDPSKLTFLNESEAYTEAQKLDLTTKVTQFVLRVQNARKQEAQWAPKVEHFSLSEKLLERQRYAFPTGWIWIDGVICEWETFQQILRHLSGLLKRHRTQLDRLVLRHDAVLQEHLSAFYAEWGKSRPLEGSTPPQHALHVINRVETKLHTLRQEYDKVKQAKEILEIGETNVLDSAAPSALSGATHEIEGLTPDALESEITNLKGVWTELASLYSGVDAIKETLWSAVAPKKIRQALTDLVENIKRIPAKYRQYEAFEHLQNRLQNYLNLNPLLTELRSDALKERHWKRVLEMLNLRSANFSDLTLGDLWNANLERFETQLRDILAQAQGEMALEEFLSTLRRTWTDYELELVVYKSRCKLIRGWDDLFALMDDHLSSLQSMKLSPYYKIFEEETNSWDDKLNRLRVLMETWMEMQRKWVYLEGVFSGSADIQALLPNEFARFRSIDNDFLAIMKKTASRPKLLEIAATDGLQRSLDRLSDLLSKIQKALGEYLERQRFEFPRFYFVGDEDLLEMIGNSKDAKIVQRHLNKMFAGIANFVTSEEDCNQIIAMSSREGETVQFTEPINVEKHSSLNSWLRACEKEMSRTLADLLTKAVNELSKFELLEGDTSDFFSWLSTYPCQIVMLSIQIEWTSLCTSALRSNSKDCTVDSMLQRCFHLLNILAAHVLQESDKLQRIKLVQLITEVVHQRDVCRRLIQDSVSSEKDFAWVKCMRFYFYPKQRVPTERLYIHMANATFVYGFEYLGVAEKLVQTPLTDKCYLTLTQALHLRMGGNPFGPAGTGKTETVKALGAQLGRLVLVFCCDEAFDFQAMGRIFVGLCQVGAWGCFDEFNRLEERILSACSEQILAIQTGLKTGKLDIELLNKTVRLNPAMGIFVTMNPGYAGRSNLPDNLKQLFREVAMINPDKVQITEVLLYSQGFQTAEKLSGKVVALFDLCLQQLSTQAHYDFGLRSLKNVLSSAGNLKRQSLTPIACCCDVVSAKPPTDRDEIVELEKNILLRSICNTIVPKLVSQDVPLFRGLLQGVFPGADLVPIEELLLEEEIRRLCQLRYLECRPAWLEKVLQLYQIQRLNHGVMLVGPVGTGKSEVWRALLDAMEHLDGIKGHSYVLDAKSVPKEQLYGRLDATTLEWTDGVFTALLRKILNSPHGGNNRRHWIVFDGDVDPEWAENLNSVLDDNKLLTLPNGERLQIPGSVRILFEVDDLRCATLATVSRCGMVWFSDDVLSEDAIAFRFLNQMRYGMPDETFLFPAAQALATMVPLASQPSAQRQMSETGQLTGLLPTRQNTAHALDEVAQKNAEEIASVFATVPRGALLPPTLTKSVPEPHLAKERETQLHIRRTAAETLFPFFEANGFVSRCLQEASKMPHIMTFTKIRVLESVFSLLRKCVTQLVEYSDLHYGLDTAKVEKFISKALLFALCWGCGGAMPLTHRVQYCATIASFCTDIPLPSGLTEEQTLLDYEVRIEDGEWHHWRERVVSIEIDPHQVQDVNLVIETIDTIRHRHVLGAWLEEKKPFILCGPPGSGKTMTLTTTLVGLADFDIASLNFSSGTTPELLLKTFDHYCEYVKTTAGLVMRPSQPGKWLIVFADEINLPQPDAYGTQRAIMFVRMMQEYSGFWKMTDRVAGHWSWVKMERIQFAGACNPPTDAGRHPMSDRFLRHAPLLFVDFPGPESLKQIYGTFNRALLQRIPNLRSQAENLTNAMVEFYVESQRYFTVDQQPHYIYSPRELTRWKVALHEALAQRDHVELRDLIRLFIHEALRIFQDRLVEETEREWTDDKLNSIVLQHFSGCDSTMLTRPILYCCYLTRIYEETRREELRELIQAKLRVFNEEELNVQLVLFDQVLDHITRIDRVLRQPLGHLLLVGASGAGKTVLSKFVSWLNGLSVFQIKAGRNYDTAAFEVDLRTVMKRAGLRDEKITFIFDESNALGPAFLERMNALLASGEIPGLFEGDEYTQLISEAKQCYGAETGREDQDLFVHFTRQVQKNLHIVFTMNPANPDFSNRQATSPALFNRCVIDWFGDWPHDALIQVAQAFTAPLDLPPEKFSIHLPEENQRRVNVAETIVASHEAVADLNNRLAKSGKKYNFLTPRDFLDYIRHFTALVAEKEGERVDNTKHLNVGLMKLKETEAQVATLQESLAVKDVELQNKNRQAEEKMQLIIEQQGVAEERKKEAEALAGDLDSKAVLISKRREEVETELKLVEPLLRESEAAVSNIPKRNLDELRALANPPQMVKFAVEAVVVMLNNMESNPTSWEECRKVLKAGDFISRVVTFDCMSTSPATVHRIKQKYLDTENWDVDKIMRASRAAGPLAVWVQSSIDFQIIVLKVEPLRNEIHQLEKDSSVNAEFLKETQLQIRTLEEKLQSYKTEYAQLIADVQMIKQEMDVVQHKVQRSSQLLRNLASEKQRWSVASESTKDQVLTALGDCLLAAAFTTYLGFFEHGDRAKLLFEWRQLLEEGFIRYRSDLSLVEYLSKPSDRYSWKAHALPADDLAMENAIILNRYIRYPLIIDPSGQAVAFLSNQYSAQKLTKTSFTDPTFFKNLESALRFGTPLLVQDVEKVDPLLNSVLNQETHKAGGRVLITVGDSDIDFSPSFKLFFTTRDPTARFTPDLCSRVTFVNFTLTPSSLQNQCLNLVLKSERPDVDKKRSDVLKLQGEFRLRIRELEESLLHALSNVKGNILDDDNVIATLETLKAQAADVEQEAARADEVMAEVEETSRLYFPLSEAAARVFFTLQSMHTLEFFYHYDLNFFESVFRDTLKGDEELARLKNDDRDQEARLRVLLRLLFKNVYTRCAVGLMYKDRMVLALQLARIYFETEMGIQLGGTQINLLLQFGGNDVFQKKQPARSGVSRLVSLIGEDVKQDHAKQLLDDIAEAEGKAVDEKQESLELAMLTPEQKKAIEALSHVQGFQDLSHHIEQHNQEWNTFLNSMKPDGCIPLGCISTGDIEQKPHEGTQDFGVSEVESKISSTAQIAASSLWTEEQHQLQYDCHVLIREALLVKALRPDGLPSALAKLVGRICGPDFLHIPELSQSDMDRIVHHQITATVPIILIASPGFDPGAKIANLAQATNHHITSIAMGSEEGYAGADRAISSAARQGTWVLLKNVHLAPIWLMDLEKSLFRMHLHNNFRIFLTMELSVKVPLNLFRVSFVFLFEPPAGLRASLQRTYTQFFTPRTRTDRPPSVARNRLYFLLAFLHAVVLERKRYTPFGWSKYYEFSDADLQCGMRVVEEWLDDSCASGLALPATTTKTEPVVDAIDPSSIHFEAIRTILRDTVYGGRLDNNADARALESFVYHLFSATAFESDFVLASGHSPSAEHALAITALPAPDLGRSQQHYLEYINLKIPSVDEPVWLGLPPRADRLISARQGVELLVKWNSLHSNSAEDLRDFLPTAMHISQGALTRTSTVAIRAATGRRLTAKLSGPLGWLSSLQPRVMAMLECLPPQLQELERSDEAIQDALFRCFDREVTAALRVFQKVESDLKTLSNVCAGREMFTNTTRDLAHHVETGIPPKHWITAAAHKTPPDLSLVDWVLDFCYRVAQLAIIGTEFGGGSSAPMDAQLHKYQKAVARILGPPAYPLPNVHTLWIGGLQFPTAFFTATRQHVAQRRQLSLDDLELQFFIDEPLSDAEGFLIGGITLENASWNPSNKALTLSDTLSERLPLILMRWTPRNQEPAALRPSTVPVPIFLTTRRTELVSTVNLPIHQEASAPVNMQWYQRGIALILWTPNY